MNVIRVKVERGLVDADLKQRYGNHSGISGAIES